MKKTEFTEDEIDALQWIDATDINQFSLMELLTMFAAKRIKMNDSLRLEYKNCENKVMQEKRLLIKKTK
jgi:hypothetical protein